MSRRSPHRLESLTLYRVRAILSNQMCHYHNIDPMRARCVMPPQSLPAASLRTANCLPAARVLIRVVNSLIYHTLWPIWRAISAVEPMSLPVLREAAGSAGHARERISAVWPGCGGQVGAQGPQFYAEKTAKRSRLHGYRPAAKRSSRTLASPSNGKRESAMWGDMALSG